MKPRRAGYRHRPILAVVGGVGCTEQGELVRNLSVFAASSEAHIWVCSDPAGLLTTMVEAFGHLPYFNYQVTEAVEADAVGIPGVSMTTARLTRFGFRRGRGHRMEGKRTTAMHMVWNPYEMSRSPGDYLNGDGFGDFLKFGVDVRDWCKEANLPLPTSLAGIATSLLRDSRFWPDARGRVPRATNDRVRPWLPGVYQELRADTGKTYDAASIDQRRAYHRAAQEIPTPDPTTLFARGYFLEPERSPIWCKPGDSVYERVTRQPGVVFVSYSAPHARKHETHLPAITPGVGRAALWTNELEYVQSMGVTIHGIIAAWTSSEVDTGLPLYGAWASERITEADEYRQRWLKPTLHALYGLLAMRPREVHLHHHIGGGEPSTVVLGGGHIFQTHKRTLSSLPLATTNVATFGVLQAEIRIRSLKMANALSMEGATVLHIHADGLHVAGELPLLTDAWSIDSLTNLRYLDRVSWLSDQGNVLPGRDSEARAIYEQGKHLDRVASRTTEPGRDARASRHRRAARRSHLALQREAIEAAYSTHSEVLRDWPDGEDGHLSGQDRGAAWFARECQKSDTVGGRNG